MIEYVPKGLESPLNQLEIQIKRLTDDTRVRAILTGASTGLDGSGVGTHEIYAYKRTIVPQPTLIE